MNQFLEHLPWRIASLAGLLVGGISLATGTDLWLCLLRVGVAFLVFGLAGLGLRAIMLQDTASVSHLPRGQHFDQTTPEDHPNGRTPESSSSKSHNDAS